MFKVLIPMFLMLSMYACAAGTASEVSINEVSFRDSEYIEVVSNSSLNLSSFKIVDENNNSPNTLSLLKEDNSSNFFLIIGSKFQNENNLDELNCTIYVTDRSQVTNGGLKDTGESFSINAANNSKFLSYENTNSKSFEPNQSLNFQSSLWYVENKTPCLENIKLDVENFNSSNSSQLVCHDSFSIISKDFFNDEKIKFSFSTSSNNYTITYSIEDLANNIHKKAVQTKNSNEKQFTPKTSSEVFKIKAELKYDNCTFNTSKKVGYFSTKVQSIETEAKKTTSRIEIINREEFTNKLTEKLKVRVYRGDDTTKKTLYIHHNGKKIFSEQVPKNNKEVYNIETSLSEGKNYFIVSGFDIEEEIIVVNEEEIKIPEVKFNISKTLVNNENILFSYQQGEQYNSTCYVKQKNTLVSKVKNYNKKENLTYIKINNSKVRIENSTNIELKLICKYKKENTKSPTYFTKKLNYTITSKPTEKAIETQKVEIKEEFNYESKNIENKSKSILGLLAGSILMTSALIFRIS